MVIKLHISKPSLENCQHIFVIWKKWRCAFLSVSIALFYHTMLLAHKNISILIGKQDSSIYLYCTLNIALSDNTILFFNCQLKQLTIRITDISNKFLITWNIWFPDFLIQYNFVLAILCQIYFCASKILVIEAFQIQAVSMLAIKCQRGSRIFQFASTIHLQKNCQRLRRNLCILCWQWLEHTSAFCQGLWFRGYLFYLNYIVSL